MFQGARGLASALAALVLAGCVSSTAPVQRSAPLPDMPAMKRFGPAQLDPVQGTRQGLAADFLDLTFLMESGRALERFSRFEGPIRVAVRGGNVPGSLRRDLAELLGRMRAEAGLDIATARDGTAAQIVVETLPRARLQRYVPQAACFVVPNVSSWAEFLDNRRGPVLDWGRVTVRTKAAVFIPEDVAPQEVRDCLHEEIAQAVGPLNDLYRLPNSVFNDDNFHTILTRFDMLMLRMVYDPALRSGMGKAEVARALPGLLARHAGHLPVGRPGDATALAPRPWVQAIETALGPGTSDRGRVRAAQKAVALGQQAGLGPLRQGFSYYALGRLALGARADLALASFLAAAQAFDQAPGTRIHKAHLAVQLAAFALSTRQADTVIRIVNDHAPAAMQAQNASLLATLLMMKAEALLIENRLSEARAVRLDSLGWARYGFGSDAEIAARLADIQALAQHGKAS